MSIADHIENMKYQAKSDESALLFNQAASLTPLMEIFLKNCLINAQPTLDQEVLLTKNLVSAFIMTGMATFNKVVQKNDRHLDAEEAMYTLYTAFTNGLVFYCFANGLDYVQLMNSVVTRVQAELPPD